MSALHDLLMRIRYDRKVLLTFCCGISEFVFGFMLLGAGVYVICEDTYKEDLQPCNDVIAPNEYDYKWPEYENYETTVPHRMKRSCALSIFVTIVYISGIVTIACSVLVILTGISSLVSLAPKPWAYNVSASLSIISCICMVPYFIAAILITVLCVLNKAYPGIKYSYMFCVLASIILLTSLGLQVFVSCRYISAETSKSKITYVTETNEINRDYLNNENICRLV